MRPTLAHRADILQNCQMKTVSVREFTNRFAALSQARLQVRRRGKTLGTWTPAAQSPEPVDVMKRLRRNFTKPLPFTGLDLLRGGKKR